VSVEAQPGLGWTGRIMQMLQAVWTLVLVNLLFAGGVIVGLVVCGVMPAAVASATVLLRGSGDDGTVRAFIRAYRESFRRANLTGIPFLVAAALLCADFLVLPVLAGPASAALTALATVVAFLVVLTAIVSVTLLVRYRDTPLALLRYAVAVPLSSPMTAIGVMLALLAFGIIAAIFPVVIPLVGASLPLAVSVRLIDHRLAKNDPQHPAARIAA
jgi:uncharacterized membrane protein YesL